MSRTRSPEVRQAAARLVVTASTRLKEPVPQWIVDIANGSELRKDAPQPVARQSTSAW